MLYRCYKEQPQFHAIKFLIAAIGQNKEEPTTFNRVLVETSGDKLMLVATDSHSLHTVELEKLEGLGLEAGDWELLKSNANEILLFKREFEEPFAEWKNALLGKRAKPVAKQFQVNRKYDWDAVYAISCYGFNMNFDRLWALVGCDDWKVSSNEKKTIVQFVSKNLQALILCNRFESKEVENEEEK